MVAWSVWELLSVMGSQHWEERKGSSKRWALKDREEAVRNGKLATIVFIRDQNMKGQEVLGYIDYGHRLKTKNVIADNERGLLFKNKRDRKVINVDRKEKLGDNSTRTDVETTEYMQVVVYDHVTRRRS